VGCSSPALSAPHPKARASQWAALLLRYLLLNLKHGQVSAALLLLYLLVNLKARASQRAALLLLYLLLNLKARASQWAAPSPALSAPHPKAAASQWAVLLLLYLLLNQEQVSGLLLSASSAFHPYTCSCCSSTEAGATGASQWVDASPARSAP
jgi:hypothetical protein